MVHKCSPGYLGLKKENEIVRVVLWLENKHFRGGVCVCVCMSVRGLFVEYRNLSLNLPSMSLTSTMPSRERERACHSEALDLHSLLKWMCAQMVHVQPTTNELF